MISYLLDPTTPPVAPVPLLEKDGSYRSPPIEQGDRRVAPKATGYCESALALTAEDRCRTFMQLWKRELSEHGKQAFVGQEVARDEKLRAFDKAADQPRLHLNRSRNRAMPSVNLRPAR